LVSSSSKHDPRLEFPPMPTSRPPSFTLALAAGTMFAAAGSSALSQDQQRQLERAIRPSESTNLAPGVDTSLSVMERTQLDIGGSLAYTSVWLDDARDNSRRLVNPELILYARGNIDGAHGFFARARATYRAYSEGDSFDARGDSFAEPVFDRYWYEFDLRRARKAYQAQDMEGNFNAKIGRFFLDWGTGLALSETLYALRPTIEFSKQFRIEGLVSITPDHTTDFDASRLAFDRKTRRAYFGLLANYTFATGDEVFAHVLRMEDRNDSQQARLGFLNPVDFERNATYVGIGGRGQWGDNWLYMTEVVGQFGTSASDPLAGPQTDEDLRAWAGRFQVTYALRDQNLSRLQAEVLVASGDGDRSVSTDTVGGNAPGTTDTAFNALGFAIQLGADAISSFKYNTRGGIDEFTTDDRYLGSELNAYANWRITSDLAATVRYGIFLPGDAIAGSKAARHFLLLGVTLSF
jgi:hypothetical protein